MFSFSASSVGGKLFKAGGLADFLALSVFLFQIVFLFSDDPALHCPYHLETNTVASCITFSISTSFSPSNYSGAFLTAFNAFAFPIPNIIGTVSQPDKACNPIKDFISSLCASTVLLLLINLSFPSEKVSMPFINESTTEHEFNQTLQSLKNDSKLAEHWITNLIIPVFLIMLYIRAEREGDFSLHLYACHQMVPYFFAASH